MRTETLADLQNNLLDKEKQIKILNKEKQLIAKKYQKTKDQNLTFKQELLSLQEQIETLKNKLIDLQKEIEAKPQQTKKRSRRGQSKQTSILKEEIENGNT
jgi:chromosome segregation ATPase